MKSIALHAPSLLLGIGFAVLLGMAMGNQIAASPGVEVTRIVEPVAVQMPAHPSDFVRIDEGVPYTVPAGKILTIQSSGFRTWENFYGVEVQIDGAFAFWLSGLILEDPRHFGDGLLINEGSLIELVAKGPEASDGILLGYLADK